MASTQLICIRHGQSTLNFEHDRLQADPEYQQFLKLYRDGEDDAHIMRYVVELLRRFRITQPDHESPLTDLGKKQAIRTASRLRSMVQIPDVIFVSPYIRTRETLEYMQMGWPELRKIPTSIEDNLREQNFGDVLSYNDFSLFFAHYPSERKRWEKLGRYLYPFPGGESVPQVRMRTQCWYTQKQSEFVGKCMLVLSHFTTLLTIRANIQNWNSLAFLACHETIPKFNCAVSQYRIAQHPSQISVVRFNEEL